MANYRSIARQAAQRYGLDPNIFERQINQESGFNPNAVSPAGAIGIAQIMPGTARSWGVNPRDPVAALDAAARNMANYVKQFGSYRNALIAYNAGPGAVGRKDLPAETQHYVSIILGGGGNSGHPHLSPTGSTRGSTSGPSSSSLTIPGGSTIQTQADPAAEKRVILANYLQRVDPKSLLLRLGVVSPNEATTQQVSVPLPPQQVSLTGAGASNSSGKAALATNMKGVANFEGHKVAAWIKPALEFARQHGWTGQVTSGYRSYADQQRIYNSGVRPAAKPGTSNHEFTAYPGGAVDVSAAQQLAQILARSPYAGKLVYAGAKDPVHFSHPHNGGY